MSPTGPQPAAICYMEIPAPNPEQAAKFYSEVFGWSSQPSDLTELNYWMFHTGDGQLMGGFTSERTVQASGIIFYIRVDDINKTLEQLASAGGSVISAKEAVGGNYGFTGIFMDPAGNQIGLWSQS